MFYTSVSVYQMLATNHSFFIIGKFYSSYAASLTCCLNGVTNNNFVMQAQAAAAMGMTAKSAGRNIDAKSLTHLVKSLLNGLSGRTWNGKESLLTALSDIVSAAAETLKSDQSELSTQDIVSACLREAKKQSMHYKVS